VCGGFSSGWWPGKLLDSLFGADKVENRLNIRFIIAGIICGFKIVRTVRGNKFSVISPLSTK